MKERNKYFLDKAEEQIKRLSHDEEIKAFFDTKVKYYTLANIDEETEHFILILQTYGTRPAISVPDDIACEDLRNIVRTCLD